MRRTTAILTVSVCALTGCQGSGAQEPYDGVIAAAQRSAKPAPTPTPQAPETKPIASEVDVPWAIALLSDATAPPASKPGQVIQVDTEPDLPETVVQAAHLDIAVDPGPAEGKPTTPKTCSGVVKTRS